MAATAIRLKVGSTTLTFDESGTDGKLIKYDPVMPREKILRHQRQIADGDDLVAFSYANPKEEAKILLEGTYTQIQTIFQKIVKIGQQARRNAEFGATLEDQVFLEVLPETESTYWRSKIFSITPHIENDALDLHIDNQKIVFVLQFIREYFFEHTTKQTLFASNTAIERTQSGVTVYNSNDAVSSVRYNWLDILNQDIDGDLPAPVRMSLERTYNDVDRTTHFWYGLDYRSVGPTTVPLRISSNLNIAIGASNLPGSPDNTLYENGQYSHNTFTNDTSQIVAYFSLTQAQIDLFGGNFYRVLIRMPGGAQHADFRLEAEYDNGGSTPLWTSGLLPVANTTTEIFDFGVFQMPPFLPDRSDFGLYPVNFRIYAKRPAGSSGTWDFDIDWIQFLPTDSWGIVRDAGFGWGTDDIAVDDAIDDLQYVDFDDPNGGAFPSLLRYGTGIWVTPHIDESAGDVHRIWYIWEDEDELLDVEAYLKVTLVYRPRRLFL